MWCCNGKLKQGSIFNLMVKSRAVFKSVLRKCRKDKNVYISDSLAKKYLLKDSKCFWSALKHIHCKYE